MTHGDAVGTMVLVSGRSSVWGLVGKSAASLYMFTCHVILYGFERSTVAFSRSARVFEEEKNIRVMSVAHS